MRRAEEGMDQAQQPHPCRPRPPVSPSQVRLRHNSPTYPVWYSVSLIRFFHRSCVVVSPVPAACPMWLLDTPFETHRNFDRLHYKGKVFRPSYYGGHFIEASIGVVFQVRFWERGKVAMGSCSLLPSQLWWDNVRCSQNRLRKHKRPNATLLAVKSLKW